MREDEGEDGTPSRRGFKGLSRKQKAELLKVRPIAVQQRPTGCDAARTDFCFRWADFLTSAARSGRRPVIRKYAVNVFLSAQRYPPP